MRRGEFAQAWLVSDAVLRSRRGVACWHLPRHEQYIWDGSTLEGKRVLVRCYHGLGDTIMFARYAALLKAVAREVVFWAQPALIPLLRTVHGIDDILPLHDGTPAYTYDVDVESMELAHVFRTTVETIPRAIPYVSAEPAWVASDGQLHVGLVWSAGDWHREYRSLPWGLLARLTDVPGLMLHVLQRGPALQECPPGFGVQSGSDDILEAARVIRALDLLLTVDSMPAHLAGALGQPVWTLLAHRADWRWMQDRDDSPWYPTMHLFRQPRAGDWTSVVAAVTRELTRLAAERSGH